MTYEALSDGQHYSQGPAAVHTQVPTMEVKNNVPFYMFKPPRYSEHNVLRLLKKGIGEDGSIRSHGPAVRNSIVESLKPYPKLFQHYIKS